MQTIRVGITGKGVAVRLHKPVLAEVPYLQVVSVHLPNTSDIAANLEDSITLQSLDLLIIGTPTYKQISHIEYSLPYCPVILCEKPVGCSLKDISRLRRLSEEQGRTVFVNFQLRYAPQLHDLEQFINNVNVEAITFEYKSSARAAQNLPSWYCDLEKGGGIIFSVLPHLVEILHY